jgi:hypothetical protein
MLLSRHQNAGQNRDIKTANRCFENLAQFRYLVTTVTNENLNQMEIKRRLNSVQILLSSCLLCRNIKIRIHKTTILPVVLYGCETLFLTLREEHKLRVLENRVLRRIFELKRNNEELHNLLFSPNIIRMIKSRRMRWANGNAYRILVGKPEGKRPLGRPIRRWSDNITMDLREIGWDGMDWIDLAQDRDQWRVLVNTEMNFRVP